MDSKVYVLGVEKGGASKTTTCGVLAHLLSQDNRVLVVDMDSQGNVSELLTGLDSAEFMGRGVLEAMQDGTAEDYIIEVNDNLHVLAGHSDLALLSRWLYSEYKGDRNLILRDILAPIRGNYKYILIDTPPALGDQTLISLAAADYVLAMYETSKYCYSALGRFLATVEAVKDINPDLRVAGIVTSMIDKRRSDNKALLELVQESYPDQCFQTVIYRNAPTGRLSIHGFFDNPELKQAVSPFIPLLKEVLNKCQ